MHTYCTVKFLFTFLDSDLVKSFFSPELLTLVLSCAKQETLLTRLRAVFRSECPYEAPGRQHAIHIWEDTS